MARIDDAVSRILRVKLRAGLFDDGKPSTNECAGKADALQARDLAREAVRKSLVLLKNQDGALPLVRGEKILVVGKSADDIGNQSGGWTLRSEEHTSELQSLMRTSYAVFCLKKQTKQLII